MVSSCRLTRRARKRWCRASRSCASSSTSPHRRPRRRLSRRPRRRLSRRPRRRLPRRRRQPRRRLLSRADTDAAADADTDSSADADTDSSADADTDSSADADTDSSADADTDSSADADTDSSADADTDSLLPTPTPTPVPQSLVAAWKVIDADGDLETFDDQTLAAGWEFNLDTEATIPDEEPVTAEGEDGFAWWSSSSRRRPAQRSPRTFRPGYELLDAFCEDLGALEGEADPHEPHQGGCGG